MRFSKAIKGKIFQYKQRSHGHNTGVQGLKANQHITNNKINFPRKADKKT